MLKKRFTIVAIMTLIVMAMMLFIDVTHSIREKKEIRKELVQKSNNDSCVGSDVKDSEC